MEKKERKGKGKEKKRSKREKKRNLDHKISRTSNNNSFSVKGNGSHRPKKRLEYLRLFATIDSPFFLILHVGSINAKAYPGNTKGGSITVPLTSCLTGLG
jgi:hypothetical protein